MLLTCAGFVELGDSSFIPFGTMEDRNRARPPWFPVQDTPPK